MWEEAVWLGVPKTELEKWKVLEGDMTGRFAYFRCEIELEAPGEARIAITANSRYRLWVNGKPVLSGPCKGDLHRHYYEEVDISEYLGFGANVLAVQVLYCDPYSTVSQSDERASIFGVLTPGGGHRLAVQGEIVDCKQGQTDHVSVTTGEADWRVWLDGSSYLKSDAVTVNLGAIKEEINLAELPHGWKQPGFCAKGWQRAKLLETVCGDSFMKSVGLVKRFQVRKREIPLMYEKEAGFFRELTETHILETGEFLVPEGGYGRILLDAGEIVNAYPVYKFEGGRDGAVSLTYAERCVNKENPARRDDWENGTVTGLTDQICLDGKRVCYEPFWYRTFRFLKIEVYAEKEPVKMFLPIYRKTGYPLQVKSWVRSSAEWVGQVWEMCVRTLKNCMMETYMDCPYYEQMQFPMDTRLQALFSYTLSTDTRLAKKALEDFHSSMLPEGLIYGKYPAAYCQVISTFSLHYIFMLLEYYEHTGDAALLRRYRPDVDIILDYYDRKIGESGMVEELGYWEFVDWQEKWKDYAGMPAARTEGPSTLINLMYAFALQCGARIYDITGRHATAQEYMDRLRKILETVRSTCWDEERGMFREGPDFMQFSQHTQAWAVLSGARDPENGRDMLKAALSDTSVIRGSFSTSYEWFRALEKCGMYCETKENMIRWAGLPELGCTTCPEEPENGRSECHAWSALPIFEMIHVLAGIRPHGAGWKSAVICPHLEFLPDLEGEAAVPGGRIHFSYKNIAGTWRYEVALPPDMDGIFRYPDGREAELKGGVEYEL